MSDNIMYTIWLLAIRCHREFVPMQKHSGGTYSLVDTFPWNISASVGILPRIFAHAHKCSASVNERTLRESDDIEVHYHYRIPEFKDVPMIV